MPLERTGELASQLFAGEEWFENRKRQLDGVDLQVVEAISQLPEFNSFTDEQKREAVRVGLVVKANVLSERLRGHFSRQELEEQIDLALKTGKEVGIEFTRNVIKASRAIGEEAFGFRK